MDNSLIVNARENYLVKDGYGKNDSEDTVALATSAGVTTATVTAGGAGNEGDAMYIYPYLISNGAAGAATSGEVVDIRVRYVKSGIGVTNEDFTFTFSTTPADLAATVVILNDELTRQGYLDEIEFSVSAGKMLIQAKKPMVTFGIKPTTTYDMDLPIDAAKSAKGQATFAHQLVFKVPDFGTGDTSIEVNPYHETVKDSTYSLSGLRYIILKDMGESTSSTLEVSDDASEYSGNSFMTKQVEYVEGSISFNIDEQEVKFENLVDIKNWTEGTGVTTPYGKVSTDSYTMKGRSLPIDVQILSFSHDVNDVLHTIFIEKARSQDLSISMNKTDFRTYSDSFTPMTPDNKVPVSWSYQL